MAFTKTGGGSGGGGITLSSLLTGFTAGAGSVSSSDSILGAFQKIVGNMTNFLIFSGPASSVKTYTLPNASDTIACLGQKQAYSKPQYVTPVALADSSTVSWDMSTAQNATLATTQSFTLSNPTNLAAGMSGMLTITQDSGGSRVITWSSAYKFAGGTKFVLSTVGSSVDTFGWYSPDGTTVHVNGLAAFS